MGRNLQNLTDDHKPLADRIRPNIFDEVVGHAEIIGEVIVADRARVLRVR